MSGGPPDKFTSFAVSSASQPTLSSAEVLAQLNTLAGEGYDSVAVSAQCADGLFIFVGGYE